MSTNPVEIMLKLIWRPEIKAGEEFPEKLNQEKANILLWDIVDRLDKGEKSEAMKMIEGGSCGDCGTPYAKRKANPKLGDFYYFLPVCNCQDLEKSEQSDKKIVRQKHRDKIFEAGNIPKKYWDKTFESFEKEQVNPKIKDTIVRFRKYLVEKKYWTKGLIFYGDVGTGKTHLAIGLLKWLMIEHGVQGYYFRMADLLNLYFNHGRELEKIIEQKRFFVLDDIDKISDTVMKDERLYSLVDTLYGAEKIVFITGNFNSLGDLPKKLSAPVASRILEMCYNEALEFRGEDWRL